MATSRADVRDRTVGALRAAPAGTSHHQYGEGHHRCRSPSHACSAASRLHRGVRRAPRRQHRDGPRRLGDWDAVAQCESGGNWSANTGNGYYGGLQSSVPAPGALTVVRVCRTTIPARKQIRVAEGVLASSGRERGRRADSLDARLSEGTARAPGAHERSLPVGMPQPTLTAGTGARARPRAVRAGGVVLVDRAPVADTEQDAVGDSIPNHLVERVFESLVHGRRGLVQEQPPAA